MSSRGGNQALIAGIAVVAAVIIGYALLSKTRGTSDSGSKAGGKRPDKELDEDLKLDEDKATGVESPDKKDASDPVNMATPVVSNKAREQGLHSQIEDLDKKGKLLFKQKQVQYSNVPFCPLFSCFSMPWLILKDCFSF